MDFVVLGFGVGALAVLVGLGMRDLGPMLRRVPSGDRDDLPWSEIARRIGWGRTCRATGLVVTLCGAALCLLTLLILIAGADDGFGMGAVLATLALALVVGGVWAALFARQANPDRAGVASWSGIVGESRRRSVGPRTSVGQRNIASRAGATNRPVGAGAGRRRTAPIPPEGAADHRQRTSRSRTGTTPATPPTAPDATLDEETPRRVERGR